MDVFTSSVSDFSSNTFVGSFAPSVLGAPDTDVPISVFDLADTNGQFVRLHINSFANLDGCNCLGISEVTLDVGETAVPEPATVALPSLGLAGLGVGRHKKA